MSIKSSNFARRKRCQAVKLSAMKRQLYKDTILLRWIINVVVYFLLMLAIRLVCSFYALQDGTSGFDLGPNGDIFAALGGYAFGQMLIAGRKRKLGWIFPLFLMVMHYLFINFSDGAGIPYEFLKILCPPLTILFDLSYGHPILHYLLPLYVTVLMFVYLYIQHLLVHAVLDKMTDGLRKSRHPFCIRMGEADMLIRMPRTKLDTHEMSSKPVRAKEFVGIIVLVVGIILGRWCYYATNDVEWTDGEAVVTGKTELYKAKHQWLYTLQYDVDSRSMQGFLLSDDTLALSDTISIAYQNREKERMLPPWKIKLLK